MRDAIRSLCGFRFNTARFVGGRRIVRRGFTLIELMFVLVILGIILATTLPKMRGSNERSALQTTARDLARLCNYARQVAVSSQDSVTLTIAREDRLWWIDLPVDEDDRWNRRHRGRDREPATDEEIERKLHDRLNFAEILVNGRDAEDDEVIITFYPNGGSTGATILIESQGGRQMTVEIEKATGRASAYSGEPRTFGEKLAAAGVDASRYGSAYSPGVVDDDGNPVAGAGFSRVAGSEDERVAAYTDVAARIMGGATRKYDKEHSGTFDNQPQESSPERYVGGRGR